MLSDQAKVLQRLNGRPMIHYVLDTAQMLGSRRIIMIVGHQADKVRREVAAWEIEFATQEHQLGTGHAVQQAKSLLINERGIVLVLAGDTPLISPKTLEALIHVHHQEKAAASLLTARVTDPTGLGRIIRDHTGRIDQIVEEKDATKQQRILCEINTSTYCFEPTKLLQALDQLKPENRQGEFYLTDTIGILRKQGHHITGYETDTPEEITGVNTPEHLSMIESWLLEHEPTRPTKAGKNS